MIARSNLMICMFATAAPTCIAQPQGEVKFSIEWTDDGNANGVLEPGEIAIGKVYATFTPKGTPAKFTNGGKTYDVVIEGWRACSKLGVYTTQNGQTGESFPVTTPPLGDITPWWTNGHDWWELGFYQDPPPSNKKFVYDNPIWVFSLLWATKDFTPRYVEYFVDATSKGSHSLYASTPELPAFVWVSAQGFDSPTAGFWVVPAPGSVSIALVISACGLRRRRRSE